MRNNDANQASQATRYRAVVVGCGNIGSAWATQVNAPGVHSHAQAYRLHPRTELVGLADTDPQRAEAARRLWDVPSAADAIEFCCRLRPDIVSLCTPDATHASLAQQLIRVAPPRLLFIEKPLALQAAEGEALLQAAARQGTAIAVNYCRRFSPACRALASELQVGQHGRPMFARVLYSKGLLHNGGHAIDLLRFWLGEPIEARGYPTTWDTRGANDAYSADLRFANDCRVRFDVFDERIATVFELDFLTEKSRWRCWLGGSHWEFTAVMDSPIYPGYKNYLSIDRAHTDAQFANPLADCLQYAVENLVEFLDGQAPLVCTGEDGLAVLKWVERIRQGA